jgi:hydroxymethylglutaryl-CoA lyase
VEVSGAIATAFGYHAEGVIPLDFIYPIVDAYLNAGIKEISMSDSTGMATPEQVFTYMSELKKRYSDVVWTLHPHNTFGMGMANIYAALLAGVSHIDASFAGLGGCPFIKGASGNVATEDLLNMLHSMGVETGIDLDKMLNVARKVEALVGHPGDSAMLKVRCSCAE